MTKTYGNFTDFVDFSRSSSATYLGSDGLIKTAANNIPRVEYDANGVVKGLLIEEARTNYTITSSDFSVNWSLGRTGVSVEHGGVSDPAGGTSASTFTYSGVNAAEGILDDLTANGNTTYTFSIWLKSLTLSEARLVVKNRSSDTVKAQAIVNLTSEWQRFSVTGTTDGASTGTRLEFTTNGASGSMDIWGAQLEQGSFPTSYIPTAGATATRAADIASIATANFGYNKGAGTVVVNFDNLKFGAGGSGFPRPVELGSSAHAGERINFYVAESSGNFAFGINTANAAQAGGTLVASTTSPVGPYKAGIAYKKDNVAAVETGGDVLTDTSADISGVVYSRDTLKIGGSTIATTHQVNGHIKSIKYLPRRLTNTQLQEQTA